MKFLLVLACLVVYANAHACLLFPQQRGSLTGEIFRNAGNKYIYILYTSINNTCLLSIGDDLCFHITDKPCGGTQPQTPQVTFQYVISLIYENFQQFIS